MIALILLIIFGLGVSYFATQNTGTVHILFGNFLISGVPIYIIVVGSMLIGVFVSWMISLVNTFSSLHTIKLKDSEIKNAQKTIEDLKKDNHELELEKTHLEEEVKGINTNNNDLDKSKVETHSFFHNIRQGLADL